MTGEPRRFEYLIEAETPIDVFMMAIDQYMAYRSDEEFSIIPENSSLNTDTATGSGLVASTFWMLVIDNSIQGGATPIQGRNRITAEVTVME